MGEGQAAMAGQSSLSNALAGLEAAAAPMLGVIAHAASNYSNLNRDESSGSSPTRPRQRRTSRPPWCLRSTQKLVGAVGM